jgi:hypothetical protein
MFPFQVEVNILTMPGFALHSYIKIGTPHASRIN